MKIIFTKLLFLVIFFANAQSNPLRIYPNIVLPKDSNVSRNLIHSLNGFLISAQNSNEENKFVFVPEKIETYIQLDEFKEVEKSKKYNDNYFYKPYLTNVVELNDTNYLIQISYIGIFENTAILRASFELIAHLLNDSFVFSSMLIKHTKNWKIEKIGNYIFHYKNSLNIENAREYCTLSSLFDSKLKSINIIENYYLCDDLIELEKIVGVNYKLDYNGSTKSVWSTSSGDRNLIIFGNDNSIFSHFDPHDLFHERLNLVIDRSKLNRSVDEGCAYLYGGSWGFSWQEIFKAFKEQVSSNKNTDWVEIKETPFYFKTGNYPNPADNIVNALIVQKIEKEKGFAGVWELLNVGPKDKGNEKYYQTLEKLTGISKSNYNDKVWELIKNEK